MPNKPPTHRQQLVAANPALGREDRGSSSARGYDWRWRTARLSFLRRNPLCLYCRRRGVERLAELVDHNPPHLGDMVKFWDVATWVPCCEGCHGYVTPVFDGGGGNAVKAREGIYVAPRSGEIN